MKTIKLALGLLFVLTFSVASTFSTNPSILIENTVTEDKVAQFPGGTEKMNEWIKENLRTPEKNVRYGIVKIEFTVKKNGKCANFIIKKGINEDMDLAAVECLQGMPLWEPAVKEGKKINSTVIIPVKFSEK